MLSKLGSEGGRVELGALAGWASPLSSLVLPTENIDKPLNKRRQGPQFGERSLTVRV